MMCHRFDDLLKEIDKAETLKDMRMCLGKILACVNMHNCEIEAQKQYLFDMNDALKVFLKNIRKAVKGISEALWILDIARFDNAEKHFHVIEDDDDEATGNDGDN